MDLSQNLSITKKITLRYAWKISEDPKGCEIKSPIFPMHAEGTGKTEFNLKLYVSSKNRSSLRVSYNIEIRNKADKLKKENTSTKITIDPAKGTNWVEVNNWNFYAEWYSHEFPLTISCTLDIEEEKEVSLYCYRIPSYNLWKNFETLLTTGSNADVTLFVNDRELKAHKAIMLARSPVFDAMFSSQMTESIDSRVVFDDIDFEVLQEMLRFMYTGKAPNVSEVAVPLLRAADKYELPMLQAMCEQEVGSNLSVENAVQTLVLADQHHAHQLKQHTLGFINRHALQFIDTGGWREVVDRYPDLLDAVIRSLAVAQLKE